ncbi:MAG: hypothetical protein B6U97_04970 [Candidatus Altiarchaeales archaeon ex4484_96]|nr:MAG: hypothetical protein B6U97_04970 [Candidatus Altiarchaeales archaeon ex4484_96]
MVEEPDKIANVCRAYGLRHFASRYGIGAADIREFSRKHQVDLTESEIRDEVVDWVDTGHGKLPFFEEIRDDVLVERKDDRIKVNFDVFHAVGKILGGHLEKLSVEDRVKIVKTPFLDIYEQVLFDVIKEQFKLETKPYWPENKNFSVCLTHDVDEVRKTYQYFTQFAAHIKKRNAAGALIKIKHFFSDKISRYNPYWTFEELMRLEDSLGVRSTFYFLQEDSKVELFNNKTWRHHGRRYSFRDYDVVKIMQTLAKEGWEVGLHGSFNSFDNKEKLTQELNDLEESFEDKVYGIRQHNLNLKIPETWQYQGETGLEYDSTLGFNRYIGFRYGTSFPFNPINPSTMKQLSILEIPMIIEDIAVFRYENPWIECRNIINKVEKQGGVVTLLWHHSVFNEREFPGYLGLYEKIINYCKERNAWIATANEINRVWRSRKNA